MWGVRVAYRVVMIKLFKEGKLSSPVCSIFIPSEMVYCNITGDMNKNFISSVLIYNYGALAWK